MLPTGQTIGVTLDTIMGTLSFSINGKPMGVAFSVGLQGYELYPAVSLFDLADQVSFQERTQMTQLYLLDLYSLVFSNIDQKR